MNEVVLRIQLFALCVGGTTIPLYRKRGQHAHRYSPNLISKGVGFTQKRIGFCNMMIPLTLLMMGVAYLFGSLSSAVVICRAFSLPDPRTSGSKNPGATNVYRIGGRVPALLVLVMDILKGTIPVYSSYFIGIEPVWLGLIAIAACLGHIFPLYFGFQGGKAVATAFGAMLPIGLDLAGLLILSWIIVVFLTGYSSLGALVAVSLAPLFTWLIKPLYTIPVAMLSLLIIVRHRENISRLLSGNESKIWDKGNIKE